MLRWTYSQEKKKRQRESFVGIERKSSAEIERITSKKINANCSVQFFQNYC